MSNIVNHISRDAANVLFLLDQIFGSDLATMVYVYSKTECANCHRDLGFYDMVKIRESPPSWVKKECSMTLCENCENVFCLGCQHKIWRFCEGFKSYLKCDFCDVDVWNDDDEFWFRVKVND